MFVLMLNSNSLFIYFTLCRIIFIYSKLYRCILENIIPKDDQTLLLCRYTLTYFHVSCNLSRLDFFKIRVDKKYQYCTNSTIQRVLYYIAQTVFHVYFLQLPLALSQLCCCHVIIIKEIMKYSMINS